MSIQEQQSPSFILVNGVDYMNQITLQCLIINHIWIHLVNLKIFSGANWKTALAPCW